jgi:hypothetical protein
MRRCRLTDVRYYHKVEMSAALTDAWLRMRERFEDAPICRLLADFVAKVG